jgi:hypothetical protein
VAPPARKKIKPSRAVRRFEDNDRRTPVIIGSFGFVRVENDYALLKSSSNLPLIPLLRYPGGGKGWGFLLELARISADQNDY